MSSMSSMSIEERLIEKMQKEFESISSYVQHYPMIKENACYDNDNDNNSLKYMSYTRPLFVDEEGNYLILMVSEWRKEDQEIKTIYLWNGKVYLSFHEMVSSIKSQFLLFKRIFDFS